MLGLKKRNTSTANIEGHADLKELFNGKKNQRKKNLTVGIKACF
jgi:hypothetical protein